MKMNEKAKSSLAVIAVIAVIAGVVLVAYFLFEKAADFITKMHGG